MYNTVPSDNKVFYVGEGTCEGSNGFNVGSIIYVSKNTRARNGKSDTARAGQDGTITTQHSHYTQSGMYFV